MPRVSVIIPSFNHERFLNQCLESVRAQTMSDWEVVLVDDGSHDQSVEIARQVAATDPRIKVFLNDSNLGAYATENRGLELAQGEFAAVLNSDDYWMPLKLERQVTLLDSHPECPFAYGKGYKVDDIGKPLPGGAVHHEMPTEAVQDIRSKLVMDNRILASSLMFRRGQARFEPSLKYSGDWTILLKLAQQGPAAFVNEDVCVWRIHSENAHADRVRHFGEEMRVREAILAKPERWISNSVDPADMKHCLAIGAFHLHSLYVLVGETTFAKQLLRKILELEPQNKQARKRLLFSWLPLSIQRRRICPNLDSSRFLAVYPKTDRRPLEIEP